MPLILAIETATKLCSVAVARDGRVLALLEVESQRHEHAEKVNVFIAEVLEEAGLALKDLDAVAVGKACLLPPFAALTLPWRRQTWWRSSSGTRSPRWG